MAHKFRSAWSDLFSHLLERQGFNQTTFGLKVRKPQAVVQAYAAGRIRPPRHLLVAWSDALDLKRSERDEFIFLGFLAWAPPVIQKAVTDNRRELREAQRELAELRQRIAGRARSR